MALTLFRLGIYILLAVLALWVLRDAALSDFAHILNDQLLNRGGLAGVGVLVFGLLVMLYEKATAGRKRTRCKVCRKPVIAGEFYCREHLREIVERGRNA